jgi:hypothetical protein
MTNLKNLDLQGNAVEKVEDYQSKVWELLP